MELVTIDEIVALFGKENLKITFLKDSEKICISLIGHKDNEGISNIKHLYMIKPELADEAKVAIEKYISHFDNPKKKSRHKVNERFVIKYSIN